MNVVLDCKIIYIVLINSYVYFRHLFYNLNATFYDRPAQNSDLYL